MAAEENFEVLGQESGQKRDSARTEERFPIEFQPIAEAEFRTLRKTYTERRTAERNETGSGGGSPEEFADQFSLMGASQVQLQMFQQTMRAIRQLELKVDEVMAALGGRAESRAKMQKAMCVDLSAGGMKIITGYRLRKDDYIRLVITLPPLHPVVVGAIGRIVKVSEVRLASGKTACEAAVFFEAIHEEDREELVSYSFKRQRQEAFKAVDAGGGGEEEEEG